MEATKSKPYAIKKRTLLTRQQCGFSFLRYFLFFVPTQRKKVTDIIQAQQKPVTI